MKKSQSPYYLYVHKSVIFKKEEWSSCAFTIFCALGTAAESKAFINYYYFKLKESYLDDSEKKEKKYR